MTPPPRIIGAHDPGTYQGLVVLDCATLPPRILHVSTPAIAEKVALPKPKVRVRKDGTERIQTHHRPHTSETVDACVDACVKVFTDHGVTEFVGEWVTHMHASKDAGIPAAVSQGTYLLHAAHVGDGVYQEMRRRGVKCARRTAPQVRAALTRRRIDGAGEALDPVLEAHVPGWLAYLEAHPGLRRPDARDALALALAYALPEPVRERARRATGKPRVERKKRDPLAWFRRAGLLG